MFKNYFFLVVFFFKYEMYENLIILFNIELISFINGKVICIEENVVMCI